MTAKTSELLKEIKAEAAEMPELKRRNFLLNGIKLTAGTALAASIGRVLASSILTTKCS